VAFSGGVDSTLLAYLAQKNLGTRALAVTVASPFFSLAEKTEVRQLVEELGLRHCMIYLDSMDEEVLANPELRCYLCKKRLFGLIKEEAAGQGIRTVLEGSNADDLKDFRPGMKALSELGVQSPLLEAGLAKEDVRFLSKQFGLSNWAKPAASCLATRIPYHQRITPEVLRKVEEGEACLRKRGIQQCRVRCHGDMARIEVSPEERQKFFDSSFLDDIAARFREIGFYYSSLDLEGYKMGKLNVERKETGA
jgi:uncharacterized protein